MLCSVPKERAATSESSWSRQEKTCELGNVGSLSCWWGRAHTKQPEITDNSEELEWNPTAEPTHWHITGIFVPVFPHDVVARQGETKFFLPSFSSSICSFFLFSHTTSLISDSFYVSPSCLPPKRGIQDYLGVCHRALDREMMSVHLVQQPQLVNQVSVLLTLIISFLKFILEEIV